MYVLLFVALCPANAATHTGAIVFEARREAICVSEAMVAIVMVGGANMFDVIEVCGPRGPGTELVVGIEILDHTPHPNASRYRRSVLSLRQSGKD